ncbi:MAG TPA: hypothetical protein VN441_14005 [Syntrophomonas sp.]|nr:hypothetical protein [Syntrophomonas sp.]
MKTGTIASRSEQGSIILMTLLMFFVICLLMVLMMQLSALEMSMSQYYYRTQQTQQLADAVLEQTCAEINRCLRENFADTEDIPELPLGWREKETEFTTAAGTSRCQIRFLSMEAGENYSCYTIQCQVFFEKTDQQKPDKSVKAEVTFHFTTDYDPEGVFRHRTFTDGGVITSYKIVENG